MKTRKIKTTNIDEKSQDQLSIIGPDFYLCGFKAAERVKQNASKDDLALELKEASDRLAKSEKLLQETLSILVERVRDRDWHKSYLEFLSS